VASGSKTAAKAAEAKILEKRVIFVILYRLNRVKPDNPALIVSFDNEDLCSSDQ
jgi:hypothetical protein